MPHDDVKTIVLIEDDADQRDMYGFALARAGFNVQIAKNGEEGIALVQKHKPHLVIIDILMPDMDGIEVLNRIKQESELAAIPAVFLTNYTKEDIMKRAKRAGADDILIKTEVTPRELASCLGNYLQ